MFPFARSPGPRPWLAALLTFVVPGLGHVYQRRWTRGLGWVATYVVAFVLFVPPGDATTLAEGVWTGATMTELGLSPTTFLPPTAVGLLSAVDAYALARRDREEGSTTGAGAGTGSGVGGRTGAETGTGPETDGARAADVAGGTASAGGSARAANCVHCGRELDAEVDFCPWCGAEDQEPDDDGRSLLS